MLIDCHLHSNHSYDGNAPLAAFCQRALALGLSYICPTEHADFDPQDVGYGHLDIVAYSHDLSACQAQFNGQLRVLKGIEIDYQPRFEGKVRAFLKQHTFDFVLGSTHYVGGLYVEDALLGAHDPDIAYRHYFYAVRETAASGLFDAIGHLDLLKRYAIPRWGAYDARRYTDEIDAVLQTAVETGTGLELNTSGLRQAPAESFPGMKSLRRYRELGGEVLTLGTDAHCLEDLGRNVNDGLALARAAGFKAIVVFVKRQPRWIDIGD
jgi:histidinol-phosphatase (PHP family)